MDRRARATLAAGLGTLALGGTVPGFLPRVCVVDGRRHAYQVYLPAQPMPAGGWPVILFLHGAGERGSDGALPTTVGLGPALRRNPERFPAIVVFPQAPEGTLWAGPSVRIALAALRRTRSEFPTDPARIYLTGISMGGHGTWYLARRHPRTFAAVAPVCGWVARPPAGFPDPDPVLAPAEGNADLARVLRGAPVWIFHGARDPVVSVEESRSMASACEAAGVDVRYTELPEAGHDAWTPAYGLRAFPEWLLAQRRGSRR